MIYIDFMSSTVVGIGFILTSILLITLRSSSPKLSRGVPC